MKIQDSPANAHGASRSRKRTKGENSPMARVRMCRDDDVLDRERLRIALHGGLGQLLTSISFLASTLRQKLVARKLPEASEAAEILSLTGRAISETQALARDNGASSRATTRR
jgi:hypothetical protein